MQNNATFYKNKLLTQKDRENMLRARGFLSQETEHRRSGRTTGLAIHAIGMAMTAPGKSVLVQDHHSSDRHMSDRLRHLILTIACLLKLEHINVEHNPDGGLFVRYEVFEQVRYGV